MITIVLPAPVGHKRSPKYRCSFECPFLTFDQTEEPKCIINASGGLSLDYALAPGSTCPAPGRYCLIKEGE